MKIVIVGGGLAGFSAALPLARQGVDVTVVEAAPVVGDRQTLGGLLPMAPLSEPELFGDDIAKAPAATPIQRRERYLYDGVTVLHNTDDVSTPERWHSVPCSEWSQWMAGKARDRGVSIQTGTTVDSLVREQGRIIGVHTARGPLYADGVFLTEGHGGELVDREQLSRRPPGRPPSVNPKFQYTIDVSPGPNAEPTDSPELARNTIVEIDCAIPTEEPTRATRSADVRILPHENTVTLSIVIDRPSGDNASIPTPDSIAGWLRERPFLKKLLRDGPTVDRHTSVVRSRSEPRPVLVEHGLAVGGAVTGFRSSRPMDSHAKPAIQSGRQFAEAVLSAQTKGGTLDRDYLRTNYASPLRDHYPGQDRTFDTTDEHSAPKSLPPLMINATLFHQAEHGRFPTLTYQILEADEVLTWTNVLRSWGGGLLDRLRSLIGAVDSSRNNNPEEIPGNCPASVRFDGSDPEKRGEIKLNSTTLFPLAFIDRLYRNKDCSFTDTTSWWYPLANPQWLGLGARFLLGWGHYKVSGAPTDDTYRTRLREAANSLETFVDHEVRKTDHGHDSNRSALLAYSSGYLKSPGTVDHTTKQCPTNVFEEDPGADPPWQLQADRCVHCRYCRGRITGVEWSGLFDRQTVVHRNDIQDSSGESAPPDFGLDTDGEDVSSLPTARRLWAQLQAWEQSFFRLSSVVSPDDRQWLMTMARTSVTTVGHLREDIPPNHELVDLVEDVNSQLEQIQREIARDHLFWAHSSVRTLLDHHIARFQTGNLIPKQFEFPYQAYHRMEHQLTNDNANHDPEVWTSPSDLIVRSVADLPYPECWGEHPDGRSLAETALFRLYGDDTGDPLDTLETLGQLDGDDPRCASLLEINEVEAPVWTEAGHYNVIADLVEQWRQWSRIISRLSPLEDPLPRGQILADLWGTRLTINRVHARLMTGQPTRRAIAGLRTWFQELRRKVDRYQWFHEVRPPLHSLSNRSPDKYKFDRSPTSGRVNTESAGELTEFLLAPLDNSSGDPRETNQLDPTVENQPPSDSAMNRIANLRDWLKQWPENYDGHEQLGGIEITDRAIYIRLVEALVRDTTRPMTSTDHSTIADLIEVAIHRLFQSCERLGRTTDTTLPPTSGTKRDHEKRYESLLHELMSSRLPDIVRGDRLTVPDERLEHCHAIVTEQIVALSERWPDSPPSRDHVTSCFRLVDLVVEYRSLLALHRQSEDLESEPIPEQSPLETPDFDSITFELVLTRTKTSLESIGHELQRITEGIDHGITPPERKWDRLRNLKSSRIGEVTHHER